MHKTKLQIFMSDKTNSELLFAILNLLAADDKQNPVLAIRLNNILIKKKDSNPGWPFNQNLSISPLEIHDFLLPSLKAQLNLPENEEVIKFAKLISQGCHLMINLDKDRLEATSLILRLGSAGCVFGRYGYKDPADELKLEAITKRIAKSETKLDELELECDAMLNKFNK